MDLTELEFVRGVELDDGRFILSLQDPEMNLRTDPHSGIVTWTEEDGWVQVGGFPRITVDMTTGENGDTYLITDPRGTVTEFGSGEQANTQVTDLSGGKPKFDIRCIRRVGDVVHVGGLARQGFARKSHGPWVMNTTNEMQQLDPPSAFAGIDGFSETEVYAAGWSGELWAFDGTNWRQLQSPTNVILNDICAGPDNCVAVGLMGQVIIGRGDDWQMVEHTATEEPFWSVRAFAGAFYLATIDGIYKLEDGDLSLFRALDDDMRTSYALSVGPSGLWSVGNGDVALFDGTSWRTIGQS